MRHEIAKKQSSGRPRSEFPNGPPTWPMADDAVADSLLRAYAEGSWGRYDGPNSANLVAALAEMHQLPHVELVCSGTFAVELALRGLRIEAGQEVIVAAYDYPGNFRAVTALGARPVLVDVVALDWMTDLDHVAEALSPTTRAIIVSHLHGRLAPMRRLTEWAAEHGLAVVEDACQATGATVDGRPAGSWGDVGVLSFGGSKLLTAGRGGALMTRRADVAQRARVHCQQGNHAYPLSELQAAVLLPQLEKLAELNARRVAAVRRIAERLSGAPTLRLAPATDADGRAAYYKLGVRFDHEAAGVFGRDDLVEAARSRGVAIDKGFRGFAHRATSRCRKVGDLPHAKLASASMLVLHHPILLEPVETINLLCDCLLEVIEELSARDRHATA